MKNCKIECGQNMLRIWLDERHAIHKLRGSNIYVLEYYRFGTDHMPDEIFTDKDLLVVYQKYEQEIGN